MNQIRHVKSAKKGDKEAFAALIQYYEKELYIVARSILHNDIDCCDAVQETILKAYESISNLRQPEYFKTWLLRILINNCNDIYRKKSKVIPMDKFPVESSKYDDYSGIETKQILNSLGEDLKVVASLYYLDDMSVANISEVLEIPEGTVKSRLSRARTELSRVMNDEKGLVCL